MSDPRETIVVGTDGSKESQFAVRWAAGLAAKLGARVILIFAFEPLAELEKTPAPKAPVDVPAIRERHRHELENDWARPLALAGIEFKTRLVEDTPTEALVAAAVEHDATLVVIGSHGSSGWRDLILGSVATALPTQLGRPVVIVPSRGAN